MIQHIEVRPARAEDRETILAFCVNTWEWGDYVQHVWEQWLTDEAHGQLLVATVDEQPAGILHLQMLSETQGWLEGLRVDPQYRQRGLAREMNMAAIAEAMRRGAKIVRLVTHYGNERSIHISESNYMRRVGVFALYQAAPLARAASEHGPEKTQLATLEDLEAIIHHLNGSNIFPTTGGLYYVGFAAQEISETFLRAKIVAQQIYLLRRWERIDGLAIAEPREENEQQRLSVGYIDGTAIEPISLIAYDLRRRLAEMELDAIRMYAPDMVFVNDALGGIDYETKGEIFYTYERILE
ncbi:MAG TPA: GNAT family N-acetyltransferase [Ktedonobacteraceae bacterium]|jgi:ribosomal protein S18 acetylase RimI-like enzyme|nr:GNAT family N-acetyltransferase [Ktedonobacteraceae bacterium]